MPEDIRSAVQDLLDTPAYRDNAKAMAKQMLQASREQLTFLKEHWKEGNVKIEKMTKVGVPIAASIIDAVMNGEDPRSRLPSGPQPRQPIESTCCCGVLKMLRRQFLSCR